jgi:thiamine biosynthesis protein ThiS
MNLIINGETRKVPGASFSVSGLLEALELGQAPVLVELNGGAILSREFDDQKVCEGDVLEIIRMVAGG